ncbi:hypothetical protein MTO96_024404 [Rhipicephalus appendiculatus]
MADVSPESTIEARAPPGARTRRPKRPPAKIPTQGPGAASTPRQPIRPTPRTPPRPTTTTPGPFSVDQLICTVSDTAVYDQRVPPDDLCHYVYYTSMVISKGELTPIKNKVSWVAFTTAVSSFKKTSGGIGFDVRYVDAMDFNAKIQIDLTKLNLENVKHYGILNKLKTLQIGDDTRRTLFAFGIYNYLGDKAWETLQEVFASAINDAVADTVVAYSSVGWTEGPGDCFSHPPSIFDKSKYRGEAVKEAGRAPDILSVSKMMTREKQYNGGVKMGLSFELGTLVYQVKTPATNFDMVNAACKTMFITNMDIVPCRLNVLLLRNELFEGVNVGEVKGQNSTIMLFEDDNTIKEKCKQLALTSTNLRNGMALLLVNAHLGDFSSNSSCKGQDEKDREDPFWRIRVVKSELKIP